MKNKTENKMFSVYFLFVLGVRKDVAYLRPYRRKTPRDNQYAIAVGNSFAENFFPCAG